MGRYLKKASNLRREIETTLNYDLAKKCFDEFKSVIGGAEKSQIGRDILPAILKIQEESKKILEEKKKKFTN